MIFTFLEKLRQKPERRRKQAAFLISLFFALVILAVWMTVLYPDWSNGQNRERKAASSLPSPTAAMGSTLSTGFSAIGAQIGEMKNTLSTLASSSPAMATTSAPGH